MEVTIRILERDMESVLELLTEELGLIETVDFVVECDT